MDIITTDSDWFSIIIFIVASIASAIKYFRKGRATSPSASDSEPVFPWEEEEEMDTPEPLFPTLEEEKQIKQPSLNTFTQEDCKTSFVVTDKIIAEDSIKEEKEQKETQKMPSHKPNEKLDNQNNLEFDLRQAVIGSIILKRPDF